ncbi:hypothetical protein EYF80_066339 [Liparis tanakae]|uniref:Uncharacterized protein n=1 Tax=Liparis tanakae TaxID=230148 RepID=A0A4Z2E458_9TELE|nr:hypothetical protein EYF80_066339 [Liparis tanakae]
MRIKCSMCPVLRSSSSPSWKPVRNKAALHADGLRTESRRVAQKKQFSDPEVERGGTPAPPAARFLSYAFSSCH